MRRRLGQVLSQVLMPYFPNATNGRSLRAAFLLPSRVRTVPPQFAPKMPFRATKIKKSECARQGEICPAGRKSCPLLPGGFSCSKEHIGVSAHSLNTLRVASGQLLRRFPRDSAASWSAAVNHSPAVGISSRSGGVSAARCISPRSLNPTAGLHTAGGKARLHLCHAACPASSLPGSAPLLIPRQDRRRGKDVFLAPETILDTPPLAPAGGNFNVQTFTSRQLVAFFPGLGRADGGIRQFEGHGGNSGRGQLSALDLPPLLPPFLAAINGL